MGICSFTESSKVGNSMGAMVGVSSCGNELDEEGLAVTVTSDPSLDRLLALVGVPAGFELGDPDESVLRRFLLVGALLFSSKMSCEGVDVGEVLFF